MNVTNLNLYLDLDYFYSISLCSQRSQKFKLQWMLTTRISTGVDSIFEVISVGLEIFAFTTDVAIVISYVSR